MGLTKACSRLLGDLVQTFGGGAMASRSSSEAGLINVKTHPTCTSMAQNNDDSSMVRALITVFGMEKCGRIKKDKARKVVEKLGLICCEEEEKSWSTTFDLPGTRDEEQEVMVEEVLGGMEGLEGEDCWKKRNELLREAFKIFDEDGNGFIEAVELKRVLECLGLMDKGWDMDQIEKMLRVVDLNLDGKVDFNEFELMMGVNCH